MASSAVVVDASVFLKWYLRDESLLVEADQLLEDWTNKLIMLVEPAHVTHEVGHAMLRANRRGRFSDAFALNAVEVFSGLSGMFVYPTANVAMEDTYQVARSLGVTYYDACYLQLAHMQNLLLITADEAFFRQAGSRPEVRWLGDYPRGVL